MSTRHTDGDGAYGAHCSPTREYYLFLPKGFKNDKPIPVIFAFHGFYETSSTDMNANKLMCDPPPAQTKRRAETRAGTWHA